MAVNDQYPSLMPTLYLGGLVTASRPFGTSDAMRLAFEALANNETPGTNGEKYFLCLLLRRVCGNPPRQGPGRPVMVAARAGRFPSRLLRRRDRAIIRL